MRRCVLIGPPASGKSTLCAIFMGLDLERVDKDSRILALKYSTATVIGAADLSPEDYDERDLLWINLTMDKSDREARRKRRDALHPEKAAQKHLDNFVVKAYNVVDIDANDIEKIRDTMRRWLGTKH